MTRFAGFLRMVLLDLSRKYYGEILEEAQHIFAEDKKRNTKVVDLNTWRTKALEKQRKRIAAFTILGIRAQSFSSICFSAGRSWARLPH
jgi:hypothetical protein